MHFIFSVGYSTKDVTYVWRHENPVEMPKDMRLSQFDLLETPINYTSVNFFKGGKFYNLFILLEILSNHCCTSNNSSVCFISASGSFIILNVKIRGV